MSINAEDIVYINTCVCIYVCVHTYIHTLTHIFAMVNLQFINGAVSKPSLIDQFLGLWPAFLHRSNTLHDG